MLLCKLFLLKISIKPLTHLLQESRLSAVFTNMGSIKLVGLGAFGPVVSFGEFYLFRCC